MAYVLTVCRLNLVQLLTQVLQVDGSVALRNLRRRVTVSAQFVLHLSQHHLLMLVVPQLNAVGTDNFLNDICGPM